MRSSRATSSSSGEPLWTPVPDWVAKRKDLTDTAKLLYSLVARLEKMFRKKGRPYFEMCETIGDRLGKERKAILRAKNLLVGKGLLRVEERRGRTFIWHAVVPSAADHARPQRDALDDALDDGIDDDAVDDAMRFT